MTTKPAPKLEQPSPAAVDNKPNKKIWTLQSMAKELEAKT